MMDVLIAAGILIDVLPLIILILIRKRWDNSIKLFLAYIILSIIANIVMLLFQRLGLYNLWILNLYTSLQFVFIVLIISNLLNGSIIRKITPYLIAVIVLFSVYLKIAGIESLFNEINNFSRTIMATVIVTYCFAGLYYLYKENVILIKDFRFWIYFGFLIELGGGFFLFSLIKMMYEWPLHFFSILWAFQISFVILSRLLFGWGFFQVYRMQRSRG